MKKTASPKNFLIAAAALLVGGHTLTATAQTTTYWDGGTAGTSGFWSTATNWVGDVLPPSAADSNLVFNDRSGTGDLPTMTVSATRSVGLITFDNFNFRFPSLLEIHTNSTGSTARSLTLYTGITLQNMATTVSFTGQNGTLSMILGADNTFNTSAGSTLQIVPVISGAFRLTKTGAGTVTLTATNTFTGGLSINEGTVRISAGAGVGAAPASYVADMVVINGGTLEYTGSGVTSSSNRGFALGSGVGTISVTGSGAYQIGAVISDYAGQAGALRKTGAGTLYLNPDAASTFSGGTTVVSGTLQFGATGSLGTGMVTLGSTGGGNATLESVRGGYTAANNITVASGSGGTLTLFYSGTGAFNSTFSGAISLNDDLTVRSDAITGQAMRLTGAISGSSNITKTGTGTLRLENNNTGYSGTTTISAGTVQLGNNGTTGGIGTGAIVNNGVLTIARTNVLTLSNTMSGTGALIQAGTGTTTISNADNTYSGGTTVASGTLEYGRTGSLGTGGITLGIVGGGNATLENYLAGWTTANTITTVAGSGGTLTLSLTGNTNFTSLFSGNVILNDSLVIQSEAATGFSMRMTGVISGSGGITKTGAGVLRFDNANTYSGTTTISTGTVQLNSNATLGTHGSLGTGNVVNNSALQISRTSNYALTNQISGTGTVTHSGTGTTTLSNANTYSGGTTVNGGALMVTNTTGSATGTGSVTVTSTLGGTGTIAPTGTNMVALGGAVQPGVAGTNNGVGTLSFTPVDGNVLFQSGSGITFEISANGVNDKVLFNASGSARMDFSAMAAGSMGVTFVGGYTPAVNDSFDLLDWSAVSGTGITGLSTSLLSLSTTGFDPSWSWDISQFTTTGVITIIGVPEPSRALLVAVGAGLLCLRRRKRS